MVVHEYVISINGDGGTTAALIIASATALLIIARAVKHFANARLTWIRGTITRNAAGERQGENGQSARDSPTNARRDPLPRDRSGLRGGHVPPWAAVRVRRRAAKELMRDRESD